MDKNLQANGQKNIVTFPAESLILQEGEVNPDMYKILQGYVELYTGYGTDMESIIGIIGPGSCFGEFGLLLEQPAIYTAIAYSDVFALRVTSDRVGDFIKDNHSSVLQIMKNMAHTMSIMHRQIMDLSDEICTITKDKTNKVEEKDLIKEYSLYGGVGMKGKMHFLGARKK